MSRKLSVQKLCIAAFLVAVGIVIPMFSPIKIVVPPASFTLASHVPVFIAMMLSPHMAIAVALGTTLGFFLGGFPIVIVFRAASHLIFASLGALYLQKKPECLASPLRIHVFSFIVGLVHGVSEVLVVTAFYFSGQMSEAFYQSGFFQSVFLLVGLGSVVHSMLDFEISLIIIKVLQRQKGFAVLMNPASRNRRYMIGRPR